MSNRPGRSGTIARSAARAAASAADSEWGAVSITARSVPERRAAPRAASRRAAGTAPTNGERPLLSPQSAALACGSRSTTAAEPPAPSKSTARWTASVVLPVPPYWAITATVCIGSVTLPSLSRNGAPGKGRGHCHVPTRPRWHTSEPSTILDPVQARAPVSREPVGVRYGSHRTPRSAQGFPRFLLPATLSSTMARSPSRAAATDNRWGHAIPEIPGG